jgi:hypothetical protein
MDGPATSRPTSSAFLPQNEHRNRGLDRSRSNRAMPVSGRRMSLIHDSRRQNSPARLETIIALP